eukprot:GHRQ01016807.1.p1 GENE.GHRQ01016807.1~~GHRQ01016807.1.p1  ORF type:complete len:640 (+),score=12.43 GHRQ01016807.1:161-1921(+)
MHTGMVQPTPLGKHTLGDHGNVKEQHGAAPAQGPPTSATRSQSSAPAKAPKPTTAAPAPQAEHKKGRPTKAKHTLHTKPITTFFKPRQQVKPELTEKQHHKDHPRYMPQDKTVAPADAAAPSKLTVTTLSVQGLQTSKVNVRDITLGKYGPVPDILILTETKSKPHHAQQMWIKILRKRYHIFSSPVPKTEHARAGVMVLVSKTITELGTISTNKLPTHTQGHMLHVTVENPGSNPLHILGVYCPPQGGNQEHRSRLYKECKNFLAKTISTHDTVIVAGDFNATLQHADRANTTSTAADAVHRAFVEEAGLATIDPPHDDTAGKPLARRHTFRRHRAATPCSRIDDILVNQTDAAIADMHPHLTFVDMTGLGTDHDIMTAQLSYHGIRMLPPVTASSANANKRQKLKTPISKADYIALQHALRAQQPHKYAKLNTRLQTYLDGEVKPHWNNMEQRNADRPRQLQTLGNRPAREVVNELGSELVTLLLESLQIATETCTTTIAGPSGPDHYYSKKLSRKRRGIILTKRAVAHKLRTMSSNGNKDNKPHDGRAPSTTPLEELNTHRGRAAMDRASTKVAEYMYSVMYT